MSSASADEVQDYGPVEDRSVRDDGRTDVVEAGEAFYAPAGHTSWKAEAGTELLQISPSKELAEVEAAIEEVMKTMPDGGPAEG